MRKHRRLFMFFILLFIGVPMVIFLGMPSMRQSTKTVEDNVIAKVGGVPIMESEFRKRLDAIAAQRAKQGGDRPTYRDLDADGTTVSGVLEQITDAALVKIQEQKRDLVVNTELLSAQMQKWDWFKDDAGNFDHTAWNEWVNSREDWDEFYVELRENVARQVFLGTITASSGRIIEREIDEELLEGQTKLKFKHAKVELLVVPTAEELQTHYDENPEMYRDPELHQADFLALSIIPDVPKLALELVERARNGEDFAALANEYSDQKTSEGGSMGWRRAGEYVSPQLKPFFELSYNEISDPVLGPAGYIIYKVDEERTNDVTGEIELNGSQIVLNIEVAEDILAARLQQADEIAAILQEEGDIQTIAEEYELEVLRTDYFNRMSLEIENIHHEDLYTFRGKLLAQIDSPWEPVKAKRYIYVAKMGEAKEGDLPALEDVRDKVVTNVKNELKRSEDYQENLEKRMDRLKGRVISVDTIKDLDSDITVEMGETDAPVSLKDSLFQKKIYVQTTDIFEALKDKEVGGISGPLRGFIGAYWFFELVERDAPTADELIELKEEREEIKDRMIRTAQYEILSDYTKDLRERMMASVPYTQDNAAFDRILGRNWEEEVEVAAEGEDSVDSEEDSPVAPIVIESVEGEVSSS
ncbi:MAG: SurA N-terminal domain-containing protein, partial [Candidatus Hydrogenedentes bacterium]|nr:SurA N-terminal domain-containing protein [Candidatus Hydrogenedentota bacterium]